MSERQNTPRDSARVESPVRWIHDRLRSWLEREDWQAEQLTRWLQGYDLPPVGPDEEPYLWLLRGVDLAGERYQMKVEFAVRVARLLDEEPDVRRPGRRPDQLLYNLFMLSAGLACADQLAEPLYRVFERRRLAGEWLGLDVRDALRAALVENQIDNRLQPVWETMLAGRTHGFLPGNAFDGFRGVVIMPASRETRGRPALDAIGMALRQAGARLPHDPDGVRTFKHLIEVVLVTYPGRPTWDADLIEQADKNNWPGWQIRCLPNLFVPLPTHRSSGLRAYYLLSSYVALAHHDKGTRIERRLCGGEVLLVLVSADAADSLDRLAPRLDEYRAGNPYAGSRSHIGVMLKALNYLERDLRSVDPVGADIARSAREQLADAA